MSFADKFRGTFVQQFVELGMLETCLIVTTKPDTFDARTGKTVKGSETQTVAFGAITTVAERAENSVIQGAAYKSDKTVITITKAVEVGNIIRFPSGDYIAKEVSETNPDGKRHGGIVWEVTVDKVNQ